ncbi:MULTISPECIES: hypothetical protein [Mycolicibacterium]|uniref:hypothetical protein n=1 Tax=Mycolicibacterium TaxID=1866885 RepID=UPI0004BE25EE|nr:hypothetical protein [Mycolicibacterium neoaurum]MDO3403162.1 hypothetical protein [Mycolicibacterium neoaurum]QVI29650.1 hypothetical protein MN2019_10320 [Mycolicibacterium neoaurum]TLH57983.1 hypothetical protein C1S81_15990 [Mycolicibacterium neoaurum]WBP94776.1 hypothetical protein O7W24_00800 [Mycolicibacterium neoaurum]WBS08922.1 hypothetical protein O6072_03315 [Mycolicibacterium neoaurum]
MGRRLAGRAARQHPDLTADRADGPAWLPPVVLGVLALDGVLTALVSAFFLPLRIGAVPFPITVVVSGAVNAALVWVALQWTSSPRLAAAPMWAWLATVLGLALGGPGGDVVFDGAGVMAYAVLLLIVGGLLPPAAVLRRHL